MALVQNITLKQVELNIKNFRCKKIYLCPKSLWWTDDERDLKDGKTPLGFVPLVNKDPKHFLWQTKNAPEGWYGRHGLNAFMAAHHKNNSTKFYNKWDRYNDLIDR